MGDKIQCRGYGVRCIFEVLFGGRTRANTLARARVDPVPWSLIPGPCLRRLQSQLFHRDLQVGPGFLLLPRIAQQKAG